MLLILINIFIIDNYIILSYEIKLKFLGLNLTIENFL